MSPQTDTDPVTARIARLLDVKRRDNAEVLSALKVAEESWEGLNKEVDTVIASEFDLLATERDAVLAARDRLQNPDTQPSEKGFVFAGRVFDRATEAGLPQIIVRVSRERDVTGDPLAESVTDAAGMFRTLVPAALLDPDAGPEDVRLDAISPDRRRPIGTVRLTVAMRTGGVEKVDLPIGRSPGVAARVSAAEAARDSIDETIASVERREESMKAAHTATTRYADLTRDGLRELSDAMAADPPPIPPSVPITGVEPAPPPRRPRDPAGSPGRPPEPPRHLDVAREDRRHRPAPGGEAARRRHPRRGDVRAHEVRDAGRDPRRGAGEGGAGGGEEAAGGARLARSRSAAAVQPLASIVAVSLVARSVEHVPGSREAHRTSQEVGRQGSSRALSLDVAVQVGMAPRASRSTPGGNRRAGSISGSRRLEHSRVTWCTGAPPEGDLGLVGSAIPLTRGL